ncbi:MAG: DMT family transporter [Bacteroidales bacterium]|nr:DMT family transporter [Bacteroidales bacterium]
MKSGRVHAAALISMFFWGISYIWSKIVFETYSPLTTIFLRLTVSFGFLILVLYLGRQQEKIRREDYLLFVVSAALNPFLYFIGENFGLSMSSASLSAIIIATIPLFAPIAAWYAFKEKLKRVNLLGLVLSFAGLLVIILNKDFELTANPLGLMFLFLAVVSAVFYSILLKKLTDRYKPLTIITWQNMLGLLYFLPFFLIMDGKHFISVVPNFRTLGAIVLLGVFASSVSFILFTYTIKNLGIIKSNLYTNLIPIFTAVFSVIILGEDITFQKIIGIFIVISGVVLSESGKVIYARRQRNRNKSF